MNKRIKKKMAKRKQNEEFVKWVKAEIGLRMADTLLDELFGAIEQDPETIAHDYILKLQSADWTRSMYSPTSIIRESDACNYIFRRNNNG